MNTHPGKIKRKVLVVDDEQIIANTLAIILNQNGFEATAVYGGAHAMEAARNWSPDISLIDVIMQHVNGIDAAIAIGGMLPQCRILLISGDTASSDLLDEARALGHHFEILSKPFHPDMLIETLQA